MSATLDESHERHVWTLADHRVTQVCVDPGSCRLQSWSLQASIEIRLSVPFDLQLVDGSSRQIDPEAPEQVAPLLTMIGRDVLCLTVERAGSLEVQFGDGSVVAVEPHKRYEAFEIVGGGALEGLSYVGRPGGGSPWATGASM